MIGKEFPLTLEAYRNRDQAKWVVGDALLQETDGSLIQAEAVATYLREQDTGFDYAASTIQSWRLTSNAFPPGTRDYPVLFSVFEILAPKVAREKLDPVVTIEKFIGECDAKGAKPTRRAALKFVGAKSRAVSKAKSAIKAGDSEDTSTLVKDLVDNNPDALDALITDPKTRSEVRKKLRARDVTVVGEAGSKAASELAGMGITQPAAPIGPIAPTASDMLESIDYGTDWVLVTARYVEKNYHLTLTTEQREQWVAFINDKLARIGALRDIIAAGTSSTFSDADLETLTNGGSL